MEELHDKDTNETTIRPEGDLQASLLCSNDRPSCSSPSGLINTNFSSEDDALEYLAKILINTYLDAKRNLCKNNFPNGP